MVLTMAHSEVTNEKEHTMSSYEKDTECGTVIQSDNSSSTGADVNEKSQQPHDDEQITIAATVESPPSRPYSLFSNNQKRLIIVSGSFLTLVSYMGSTMYYPALNQVFLPCTYACNSG